MNNWIYYQPNDSDTANQFEDCVIRAITKVTGKTWLEVFDGLYEIARNHKCMPNNAICYGEYLLKHGFRYEPYEYNPFRINTVNKIVEKLSKYEECGVLITKDHAVAYEDGFYFDTWDSGDQEVIGCYYLTTEY